MEKYLIVTDLDGTLLDKKSQITNKSARFIRKLAKRGHTFVICTGRPFQGAINYYKKLNINVPIICDNGGSIHFPYDHSKDVFQTIPLDLFLELCERSSDYFYAAMSSTFDTIYYYNRSKVPDFVQHLNPPRKIYEGKMHEICKIPPINPSIYIKEEHKDDFINLLNEEKFKDIHYRFWGTYDGVCSFEIFHKNATKGDALIKLKKILNIKEENDLVFGDEMNDEQMIRSAYNGICMVNGNPNLKKIAKYITDKPNYKNGEIDFIKKYFKKHKIK